MELDELKYKLKDKLSGEGNKTTDELERLLQVKTRSIAGKLKRSLYLELTLAVLFTLLFLGILLFAQLQVLRVYFGAFSVLCVVFAVVITLLLKKVNHLTNSTLDVKHNLSTLVNILQEYTRRYFQFTMGLLPVCFLFSFYLGYNNPTQVQYQLINTAGLTSTRVLGYYLFFAVYFAGTGIALYYFTRWYIQKLYGKYISELKTLLTELNEPG